jgi:hypothetical protein
VDIGSKEDSFCGTLDMVGTLNTIGILIAVEKLKNKELSKRGKK